MYIRAEKKTGQKKKKKPVDNQPAHYYKKPVGKKPGIKKESKPVDKKPEWKPLGRNEQALNDLFFSTRRLWRDPRNSSLYFPGFPQHSPFEYAGKTYKNKYPCRLHYSAIFTTAFFWLFSSSIIRISSVSAMLCFFIINFP